MKLFYRILKIAFLLGAIACTIFIVHFVITARVELPHQDDTNESKTSISKCKYEVIHMNVNGDTLNVYKAVTVTFSTIRCHLRLEGDDFVSLSGGIILVKDLKNE